MQKAFKKIVTLCVSALISISICAQDVNWKKYPYEIIGGFGPTFMLGELGGGWLGVDRWKCAFFKGGYDLKKLPG